MVAGGISVGIGIGLNHLRLGRRGPPAKFKDGGIALEGEAEGMALNFSGNDNQGEAIVYDLGTPANNVTRITFSAWLA